MKSEEHFHDRADAYEDLIVGIVPDARAFFGAAVSSVPGGEVSVLELGSGTGYVTEMVLRANPEAAVTCIDMDPAMLAVARRKEALRGVSFLEDDFRDIWPEGQFDIVLTSLCLHHLPDSDRAAVVRRIHTTLRPGGVFVNGDVFRGVTPEEEEADCRLWRQAMAENGLPVEEIEAMLARREKNTACPDTLPAYLQKMKDAGFTQITCPYRHSIYAVVAATR
ncbi:MAG: methyltransferase domain-containing protein [Methanofollis sp.]|uniref:class I SAM-dependent methyltransferase n=1 Tax=Methanofollis sp. TaxID=2052835 RepID=UPI00262A80E7|nr:class I SAM-dependent methyltransferase [Methanofollis sp.]MDD4253768.1 methyltransferase domain-containing protein [Methanofollis sp.]